MSCSSRFHFQELSDPGELTGKAIAGDQDLVHLVDGTLAKAGRRRGAEQGCALRTAASAGRAIHEHSAWPGGDILNALT